MGRVSQGCAAAYLKWLECLFKAQKNIKTRWIGIQAENLALQFLKKQGLILIARNYACQAGEIDLIMKDFPQKKHFLKGFFGKKQLGEKTIAFIEIRYRKTSEILLPIESVSYAKQQKIIDSALCFLQKKQYLNQYLLRFDILAIIQVNNQLEYAWVKNAFEMNVSQYF